MTPREKLKVAKQLIASQILRKVIIMVFILAEIIDEWYQWTLTPWEHADHGFWLAWVWQYGLRLIEIEVIGRKRSARIDLVSDDKLIILIVTVFVWLSCQYRSRDIRDNIVVLFYRSRDSRDSKYSVLTPSFVNLSINNPSFWWQHMTGWQVSTSIPSFHSVHSSKHHALEGSFVYHT